MTGSKALPARVLNLSLAVVALLFTNAGAASSGITVSLQAPFAAPPFLVELLETAAIENASSYYPLLSTIASGRFEDSRSDEQLYKTFADTLREDGHLADGATLSSWKLALSAREATPRIEAHYQFYASGSDARVETHDTEAVEAWQGERQCKTFEECEDHIPYHDGKISLGFGSLELDRLSLAADATELDNIWTLYADISSSEFPSLYSRWEERLKSKGKAWRLRYKPRKAPETNAKPFMVNGYGVELTLKRTDYIVIDDREAEQSESLRPADDSPVKLDDASEISDLKPLSSSELATLGFKASSFIMSTDDPLDSLLKITQDFPRHAAALAQHNFSVELVKEHRENRELLLPAGYNHVWMNGVSVDARQLDIFNLLDKMRRERSFVIGLQSLGLKAPSAIELLAHPLITDSQVAGEQRYDWRDDLEGGDVIMWLNDVEKDKRYADWPSSTHALLQRLYPGQLPQVRKDIHNAIFIVDLADKKDIMLIVETLQGFVKRSLPVRFGLVLSVKTSASVQQAKTVHYLNEAYGLAASMSYLLDNSKQSGPEQRSFDFAIKGRKLRRDQSAKTLSDVLKDDKESIEWVAKVQTYLARLGADGPRPPIFVNGIAIPGTEEWTMPLSQRVSIDLRSIQLAVHEQTLPEDRWVPGFLLENATPRRNAIIIPEDERLIKFFDLRELYEAHSHTFDHLIPFHQDTNFNSATAINLLIITNFNDERSVDLVLNALNFACEHSDIQVSFVHRADASSMDPITVDSITRLQDKLMLRSQDDEAAARSEQIGRYITGALMSQKVSLGPNPESGSSVASALDIAPSEHGLLINGRLLKFDISVDFGQEDFETLFSYEKKRRVEPIRNVLQAMNLEDTLQLPLAFAKMCSVVAVSSVSDIPDGVFENTQMPRLSTFDRWTSNHTQIERGNKEAASVQIVAAIDPTSEQSQKWVPLLETLSKLDGVHMRLFLNPKERMAELPIKRFYRNVLSPEPTFGMNGELQSGKALFTGIPENALLTLAMDTPASWLVAPKECIHDLDNIKLSSLKSFTGIDAVYELEHILIEGHSRETVSGNPPRGVQLRLETQTDRDFAGTIIMANLGYFQFKANPGVYNLALQDGGSSYIYNLDSAGTIGYQAQAGENTTQIILSSFKGATIFPRLSRKPGRETDDVLEVSQNAMMDLATKGAGLADELLAKAGLPGSKVSSLLSQGFNLGQKILANTGVTASMHSHAEINIFSVASGHLYERMLNIMMLSVIRHTKHSVKFWFIEQFLSPSFKSFLPVMAAEYGFSYEMVTYKWPHWLRAQKEKQRTIWGYKILFLDVLFPLDLDKVIFVDADQIVRTDMYELVTLDLKGAPYGFTPMCDSRTEMEGFRFWKQGYWKNFLRGLPYHISALYVVDLKAFRQLAAGDRLRGQYHQLSADPGSLSNLDQDLPNHMQMVLPIHSLPQEWLWCETWCSDESLKDAKTIDLCNNPQTKEPKLERARRQVPEWTAYDGEIADLARRTKSEAVQEGGSNVQAEEMGEKLDIVVDSASSTTDATEIPKAPPHNEL